MERVQDASTPMEALRTLVTLEYDVVETCGAAATRLDDRALKQLLARFKDRHELHLTNLSVLIVDLGGTPPFRGNLRAVFAQGRVAIASYVSDRAVLLAIKLNEEHTLGEYEQALKVVGLPAAADALLREHLEDERAHVVWLDEAVRALSQGSARAPG